MSAFNLYQFQHFKSVKLSDSYLVEARLTNKDKEFISIPDCVDVVLPNISYKEEIFNYGNNSRTILIPNYSSLPDLDLKFIEHIEHEYKSGYSKTKPKTVSNPYFEINEFVENCLMNNFDQDTFTYKPRKDETTSDIYELRITIYNNNFSNIVKKYTFFNLILTDYSIYDLDYSTTDIAKWTLKFSYTDYNISEEIIKTTPTLINYNEDIYEQSQVEKHNKYAELYNKLLAIYAFYKSNKGKNSTNGWFNEFNKILNGKDNSINPKFLKDNFGITNINDLNEMRNFINNNEPEWKNILENFEATDSNKLNVFDKVLENEKPIQTPIDNKRLKSEFIDKKGLFYQIKLDLKETHIVNYYYNKNNDYIKVEKNGTTLTIEYGDIKNGSFGKSYKTLTYDMAKIDLNEIRTDFSKVYLQSIIGTNISSEKVTDVFGSKNENKAMYTFSSNLQKSLSSKQIKVVSGKQNKSVIQSNVQPSEVKPANMSLPNIPPFNIPQTEEPLNQNTSYTYSYNTGITEGTNDIPSFNIPYKFDELGQDAPKVETPKVETPKVETPKVETPKVETPIAITLPTLEKSKSLKTAVNDFLLNSSQASNENKPNNFTPLNILQGKTKKQMNGENK